MKKILLVLIILVLGVVLVVCGDINKDEFNMDVMIKVYICDIILGIRDVFFIGILFKDVVLLNEKLV